MLMGAFFGIWRADKLDSWVLGLLVGIARGRRDGAPPRVLLDPPPRGPDRRRHGDQLPRARPDRLPVHRHLRAGGDADRHPEHPERPARVPRRRAVPRRRLREPQPDDLDRARSWSPLSWVVALQDADRAPDPRGRRAPARGGHGRHQRLRDPLRRGHRLGDAGRRGRRLPLDRLRQLVQREHDRRARLHRARRGDLRQLASVRGGRRVPPVRLLERARAAPARVLRVRLRCSSRRSRTSSR